MLMKKSKTKFAKHTCSMYSVFDMSTIRLSKFAGLISMGFGINQPYHNYFIVITCIAFINIIKAFC